MPKVLKPYHTSDNEAFFTYKQLLRQSKDIKLDVMETWFRENYEDPANSCPYISAEGGYQYINGGPYDADDVLQDEFPDDVFIELIQKLNKELMCESWEWSPIHGEHDYDFEALLEEEYKNEMNLKLVSDNLEKAIDDNISFLSSKFERRHKNYAYRLAYSNIISILEVYLCDLFVFLVTDNGKFSLAYSIGKKKRKKRKKKENLSCQLGDRRNTMKKKKGI